jgi:hypothetical protein
MCPFQPRQIMPINAISGTSYLVPQNFEANSDALDTAGQQDAPAQDSAAAPLGGTPVTRSSFLLPDSAINPSIVLALRQGVANNANKPLVIDNTQQVFSSASLMAMTTWQIQGAGNPELAAAMTKLQGVRDKDTGEWRPCDPGQAQDALATVARVRGVSVEKISTDYQRFLQLADQREQKAYDAGQKHIRFNELDTENEHRAPLLSMSVANGLPDNSVHMGSNDQLRFGKMVGDAVGNLDPVFGALLSPTGGIPGPGNQRITNPAALFAAGGAEVLTNHGIAHDAGGYLRTYHDIGPGYQYVPGNLGLLANTNPLGGHAAGLTMFSNIHLYGTPTAPSFKDASP